MSNDVDTGPLRTNLSASTAKLPDAVRAVADFRAREAQSPSMMWLFPAMFRRRRMLLVACVIGGLGGIAVALLRAPVYTTQFAFVPQTSQDSRASGLASLAGQFGVSLGTLSGQGQPSQFYADLLLTRALLAPIATDSFSVDSEAERRPLSTLLDVSGSRPADVTEKTIKALRRRITTTVATRTTGVVSVDVRTPSPELSLAVAQRLIEGLNRFNLSTRQSQAASERKFVEGLLADARVALRNAEEALRRFMEANRQIDRSAELTLVRGRLERDIATQQSLVTSLVQQFEDARIREVRDTPVITVIERPAVAANPDSRRRVITVIAGVFVALLLAVSWILIRESFARLRAEDPEIAALAREWEQLRVKRTS